jgi:hypothetical protein
MSVVVLLNGSADCVSPIEFMVFAAGVASGAISVDADAAMRILRWMCVNAAFEPRLTADGRFKDTIGFSNVLNLKEFPKIEQRN